MIQQNSSKTQPSDPLLSIVSSFPVLLPFLTQADKLRLSAVQSVAREIILSQKYWKHIQIYKEHSGWRGLLRWLSKYLHILQPESLHISISDLEQSEVKNLNAVFMGGVLESVQTIDLFCESLDIHLACSLCFPNLKHLVLRSQCLSDDLLSFMSENLKQVNGLTIIKNDTYFTGARMSSYMDTRAMQKIVFKPYLLDFEEVAKVTQNSALTMKELQIDVEECSGKMIVEIVKPLKNLEKLRIYHLQNLENDEDIWRVLHVQNLTEIGLTKTYNFSMERILNCIQSPNLLVLDICDSRYASDADLIALAKGSPNLKSINISWCNNINCDGIIGLFTHCLKLEYVNLTGVKNAQDSIFGAYFNQLLGYFDEELFYQAKKLVFEALQSGKNMEQIQSFPISYFLGKELIDWKKVNILRNLKELDCRNCNSVSDKMLRFLYVIYRKARVINYYGYTMSLYVSDYESDVY